MEVAGIVSENRCSLVTIILVVHAGEKITLQLIILFSFRRAARIIWKTCRRCVNTVTRKKITEKFLANHSTTTVTTAP